MVGYESCLKNGYREDKIDKNMQTERKAYEKDYFCCGGSDFYCCCGDKCEGNFTWKKDTGISYYAKIIAGSEKKKNSECFYHIKGFDENGNDRMLTVYADQGQPYPKGKYLKITCSAKADGSNEMMWSMVKQSSIPKEAILKIRRWEKRIRQLAVKKSSQLGNNLNVQRNIDKTKKLIAFSFDDGPARENTDRVVKALAKNHARATFLCLDRTLPIIRGL